MLSSLFQLILPYESYSYLVVFLVLLACGLGLPIPEDITLTVSGILVSYHVTSIWKTILVGMSGVLVGDCIAYVAGRYWGKSLLKTKIISKILRRRNLARAKIVSRKYGSYMIFFARFMPGLRTPIYFSMGVFRKSFIKFFLIDSFAAFISVPVWILVGYFFGSNIPVLEEYMKQMKEGIYIALGVLVVLIIAFHMISKKLGLFLYKKRDKIAKKLIKNKDI
ncbi:MAG TPA: hypothetical protein DD381_01290 [Lentisphaeria bacterium]|nr:MAG: hypothetical protein A2X47_10740 [Lentisphaerae bacterium GWF2_38_69]HBM14978.1 hypothetical protein [Lentisphaeria bacterium]